MSVSARNRRVSGTRLFLAMMSGAVFLADISTASGTAARQGPQFEATVAHVVVDVIVTDSDGQFVDDLGVGDFEIFEDRVRQRVLSAQYVDLLSETDNGRGSRGALSRRADPLAGPETLPGAEASDAEDSSALGAIVFLVDIPGLDPRRKARFVEAWRDVLSATNSPHVPRAMYAIDAQYRLQELVPLGHDRARLLAAATDLAVAPVFLADSLRFFLTQIANDDPLSKLAQLQARAAEERSRAISVLRLLTSFCESLAAQTRRTALVWVSSGAIPRPRQLHGDAFDALADDPQITRAQRQLYRAANSANVSIYSVDPGRTIDRDLTANDVQRRESLPVASGSVSIAVPVLRTLAEPLQDASDATAGKAFITWGNLASALEQVELDTSRYYLLTYEAPPPAGDGEYHEVRVEVRRRGVDVRARSGYVDRTDAERWRRRVLAALSVPGLATGLPLTAGAYRSWSAGGEARLMLLVESSVTDTDRTAPGGEPSGDLEMFAVLLDGNDNTLDELQESLVPAPQPGSAEATSRQVFRYRQTWELPAGDYGIRIATSDRSSARIGATQLDVALPATDDGVWRVSDPVLLASANGSNRTEPTVGHNIEHGASVGVYIEVINGANPVALARIMPMDGAEAPLESRDEARPGDRVRRVTIRGSRPPWSFATVFTEARSHYLD